jgi:hypothetical protein
MARVAALPGQDGGLGPPDHEGVRVIGRGPDVECLVREPLRVVEAALEEREGRLQPDHEVALHRLTQLLDDGGGGGGLVACRLDPLELEQIPGAVHVTDERELGVPGSLADRDELGRHREALVEVTGVEDRSVRACEGERERLVVVESPGHGDRVDAHRDPAQLVRREVELERERGEHARPKVAVVVGKRAEGFLEQPDRRLVPVGVGEHVASEVADRRPRQPLRVPQGSRHVACVGERLLGSQHVARAATRFRQSEEEVAAAAVLVGEEREAALELRSRLFVREATQRLVAGTPRVLHRLRQLGAGLGVVVGERPELILELGRAARLDRLGDTAVETGAARTTQGVIERLSSQRVHERIAPDRTADVLDEARRGCPVEQVEGEVFVVTRDLDQKIEVEVATDHRRQGEEPGCAVG